MDDFNVLGESIWNEEEERLRAGLFEQNTEQFVNRIRKAKTIGVILDADTVCDTWRMAESLLVLASFQGCVYIEYREKDGYLHVPYVSGYGKQAQYRGYGCTFTMVMVEHLSQAPCSMEYIFQGAGTPGSVTIDESLVFLLSLSNNGQKSFFMYPYHTMKPETGRQNIFYDLDQFDGQQDVEKLPFYRIADFVCAAVSEEIHAYYKSLPKTKQAVAEAEELLGWIDGQKVTVVPMAVDSYSAFEDAMMLVLAIALDAGQECVVVPFFDQTCRIDGLLKELAQGMKAQEAGKAMEAFLEERREELPRLYEQSYRICQVFAQVSQRMIFEKPAAAQAGTICLYAAGGFPQRYIDRVFYSVPGLSMADKCVYPAACHRPVTMPTDRWDIPAYLLDGPLDEDAAWIAAFYQNLFDAMHCAKGFDGTLAVLTDFVKQAKDKESRLWNFFKRRGEVFASRYHNKLFRAAHLLESNLHLASPIQFRAASPYEALYEALAASVQARHAVSFGDYPQLSALAECLQAIAGSTQVRVENRDSVEYERTEGDQGEICAVLIQDASFLVNGCVFTGFIRLACCWDDDTFDAYVYTAAQQSCAPPGLSWLELERVYMELCVNGLGGEPFLSVNGVMPGTGLYLCVKKALNSGCYQFQGGFYGQSSVLEHISALCGGVDFLSELPEPLRELGGLEVRSFTIDYNPAQSKVERFLVELCLEQAWTVLEKPLITVNPAVCLEIYHPADFSARSFHVTLTGDCMIGEGNGVLRLSGSYSPLLLQMELLEGEAYRIQTLLSDCGIADCGCDLKIDTLHISAVPSQGSYRFAVSVCDVLKLGNFSIDSLGLYLSRSRSGFSAAFAGSLTVCGVTGSARVGYAQASGWTLRAGVGFGEEGVSAKELIAEYGSAHRAALAEYGTSDEEMPNPLAAQVQVSYTSLGGYWSVSAGIDHWEVPLVQGLSVCASFSIGENASGFFCGLSGTCVWQNIELSLGYSYLAGENCFTLRWNTLEGRVVRSDTQCYAELDLHDTNLGTMVETMVEWVTGVPFGLGEPWNILLGSITLNCSMRYDFLEKSVSLAVRFQTLDVGFAKIDGVSLAYRRGADGKYGAFVSLSGEFPWMQGASPQWDAARPQTAPAPNGKGNAYFDLRLLALGHHVDLFSGKTPATVQETVGLLREITPDLQPPYSDTAEWVVAADFGILRQDNGTYFIDAQIVFYDPLLYALRVSVGGILEGLVFDILYARINDTLGVFRGSVTLPERIRRLTIGAYTLVLPVFSADIYTDGSFRLDFGFPAGGDFSNALSFEGMAGPIPITGAAGIYIGRFSAAAGASFVPETKKGVFEPITAFGFGIRFGIGKSIDAGILKAGFSLTMTAVLEGVFARFSPYIGETADYYKVSGLIGVEGGLYGMIDFAILSASVSAAISLSAAFTFEAYRACAVQVHAAIAVSASLKINLWLFTITVSFQFHADVSASFTIGENRIAPWDESNCRLPVQEHAVCAAVLDFDHLKPAAEPIGVAAHITLPLSVTDDPCRQVTATLLLTVDADGFADLARLLLAWLTAAATKPADLDEIMAYCPKKEELESICAALSHDEALPTGCLYLFLQQFVRLRVASQEVLQAAPMQVDGVFFPFPPDTQVNGRPLSDCGMLSAKTLDAMKELFQQLALSMEDSANTGFRRRDKEMSAAEWLFRDYFVFLARQLCKDAAAKADGKTALSEIWKKLNPAGIGGMASRYHLHGLRIPITGAGPGFGGGLGLCPGGAEQPVFALVGTLYTGVEKTDRYAVGSGCEWLEIPASYEVAPDPDTYAMLAGFLENGGLNPQYRVLPEAPCSAPVAISFSRHYSLGSRTVWNIPAALPRGKERYTLQFDPAGEGQAALVVPLTLQKTGAAGVYTICAGTADSATALSEIVRKCHPVESAELYYTENGNSKQADTACILAARLDQSTETHPPLHLPDVMNAAGTTYIRLAELLFEALVTNNGGYLLIAPAEIPDTVFDAQGRADMTLLLLFATCVQITEQAVSAVVLREDAQTGTEANGLDAEILQTGIKANGTDTDTEIALTAFAEESRYYYALTAQSSSAVTVECAVQRTFPQEAEGSAQGDAAQAYVENLYSILRYCVGIDGAAPDSAYSAPVSFTEGGTYRFALPADRLMGGGDYSAVGHTVAVHCQWLDIFGNTWKNGFSMEKVCGYKDALVSLSEWPYMQMYFTVEGRQVVLYALPADREEIPASNAGHVQAAYARILCQLQDKNGVDMKFACPVLGVLGNVPLEEWAKKAASYFHAGGQKPVLRAAFPMVRSKGSLKELELRRVSASIKIVRKGEPQEGFEKVQHVTSAETEIPVPDQIQAFAQAYEAAVAGVRIVTDGKRLYEMPDITGQICLGNAQAYAPMPFFQTLYSGTPHAYRYRQKQGLTEITASYTGADGGRLAAKALHCMDCVFTPDIAAAAVLSEDRMRRKNAQNSAELRNLQSQQNLQSQMELPNPQSQREPANLMARMEEKKKRIARLLAGRLYTMEKETARQPVKTDDAKQPLKTDGARQPTEEAQEAFYQLMLSNLSNYFAIRGIVLLDASVGIFRKHARLYGTIQCITEAYGLEFSSAKLKLQGEESKLVVTVKGPETVFDEQGAALSYTDLKIGYNITHIEDHITEIVDGYESSTWLSGACGGTLATVMAQGSVRLELPALYFPEAPVFTKQQFVLDEDFTVRYRFTYAKSQHLPQVEDYITVFYQPQEARRVNENSLIDALAGFDCAGEDILQDLHTTAAEVLAGGKTAESSMLAFAQAFDAMDTLCTDLEKALQNTTENHDAQIAGNAVSFCVSEGEQQGNYAMAVSLPGITPIIEGYCTECVKTVPGARIHAGAATYVFQKDGQYLSPAEGQALLERTFLLPKEKMMDVHAATVQMYAKINSHLADEFVMRTDTIAAGGTVRADFTIQETLDLHKKYGETDLEKAIQKFLLDIGGDLEVSAECRRIDANGAEFPLFMQLPVPNNPKSLSAAWNLKIRKWLDRLPAALKRDTRFIFRLNLCFGDVLKIPRVIVYRQFE